MCRKLASSRLVNFSSGLDRVFPAAADVFIGSCRYKSIRFRGEASRYVQGNRRRSGRYTRTTGNCSAPTSWGYRNYSALCAQPFDQATADSLCAELDSIVNLRMLAIAEREGSAQVIAYFIVYFDVGEPDMKRYAAVDIEFDTTTDCELAPSVADDDQSTGVGSLVMGHLVPLLRAAGRKRLLLMDGVKTENVRAIHFYEKFGFRAVGKFAIQRGPCIDMIADP